MSRERLKLWTILMPVLALLVSSGIVGWEYSRKARLTGRLAMAEKEYARLDRLRPAGQLSRGPEAHSREGHED